MKRSYTYLKGLLTLALAAFTGWMWAAELVIPYSFDGKTGNTEIPYEYQVVMPNTALTSFTTTIRYSGGNHQVEILSVKLLDGETTYTAVATGTEGPADGTQSGSYSGINNYHNIYTFTNEAGFTANKVYTLQANLKVTNNSPSHNGNIKVSGGIDVPPFSFGVNFTTDSNQNISTTEGAGFAKGTYAKPINWSNFTGSASGNGTITVNNQPLKVYWTSRGTWNSSADTSTDDGKLLYGYLDDIVNDGRTKATVTITGLPSDKQYAVALILSGDATDDGFNGKYSPALINGETYSYVDGALVTGDAAVAATTWGSRRKSDGTTGGPTTPTEGQNVMFVEGLSGSILTITSAMDAQGVSRLTIAGVQVWTTDDAPVVTTPEDKEVVSLNFYSSQDSVSGEAGLVAAQGWENLGANGTETTLAVWNGEKATDLPLSLSYSSKNGYQYTNGVTDNYIKGYLDDGGNQAQVTVENIPFEEYSVIVYAATDTENCKFKPVLINGTYYAGAATPTAHGYANVVLDVVKNVCIWGGSRNPVAAYGVNALRVDGLTASTLTIKGGSKSDDARGGIAALQIVNTGASFVSGVQEIDWTTQPAEQLKTSELPKLTKFAVQLKLAEGATLEMDSDLTGHTIEIVGNNVTVNITTLELGKAEVEAIVSGAASVTTSYTETLGYTKDDVTYSLVYRGGMNGWTELSNWYIGTRTNGSETYWIPYTGTAVPGAPGSNKWDVGLIDGDLIGDKITADEDGYKVVNTPLLEGWALAITIANGVHVKVPTMNKLQGTCAINVDATSKMTVTNKGSGNNGTANTYNIDAEEGLVFENMPMPGGTAYLGLTGSITTGTFAGQQTIGGVTLDLGTADEGRKIVTRKLIGFTAGGATFTVADGAVTTTAEDVTLEETDEILQNVGQYKFEKKNDGYYVSFVAYAETDEIGAMNTWTKTVDGNWNTAGNWSSGFAPASGKNATISIIADTTITIPEGGVTVDNLTVTGDGTLTIAGGKLTATKIYANANIVAGEDTLALAPMNIAEGKTVTYTTTTTMADPNQLNNSHTLALKALTGAGMLVKKGTGVIGLFATAAEPAIDVQQGAIYVRETPTTAMNIAAKAGTEIRLCAWLHNFANNANSLKLEGGAQLTLANGSGLAGTITIANAAETAAKICGSSFNASTIAAAITGAGKVEFADGGAFGEGNAPCQDATTYTGVISGDLQVIISDTSAVTFTANNTYTGGTVIAEGVTVSVSNLNTIFGTGAITGAGTVKIADGTYNGLSLAQYTDANTTIEIPANNTVTGYFNNATWTCAAKIQLNGALSLTDGFGVGKYTFTGPWTGAGSFSLSNANPADVVRITGDISGFTGDISVAGVRAITFCAESTAFNQKYSGTICVHGDYAYTAKVNGTWSAPVVVENGAKIGGTGTIDNTITFKAGSIIDGAVTATGDVTLEGAVTVSGEAGATVLTCANAASLDLTKFTAPAGYKCIAEDGAVKLAKAGAFIVGEDVYETFADAFAAAIEGEVAEITIDENATEDVFETPGFKITKDVTIDLGGKTLRLTPPAVGSAGTETLGIQILNTAEIVVIKNGTIDVVESNLTAAKPIKMMINNYVSQSLTLQDVTLDGTNLVKPENMAAYTLSNNQGFVAIQNSTIKAKADGIAFDACKYASYKAPTVMVDEDSIIEGDVELSGGSVVAAENAITVVSGLAGYKVVYNGTAYTLEKKGAFEVDGVDYATLAEAYAVGSEIKLIADAEAPAFKIEKALTLDLGGKMLTLTPQGVGSTGTETLGIQIKMATTIKNGTIAVAESNTSYTGPGKPIKMLINNYADLTLKNVTLNGTNLYKEEGKVNYTLSNNCGEVTIDAESAIIANDGGIAFDVCKFGSYDAPTVTVAEGATITGKVEITGGTLTDNTGALNVGTTAGFILNKVGNVYTVTAIVIDDNIDKNGNISAETKAAIKAAMAQAGVAEISNYTITTKNTGASAEVAEVAAVLEVFDVTPEVAENGVLTVAYEFGISNINNNGNGKVAITAGVDENTEIRAGVVVAFYADDVEITRATSTDGKTVTITDISVEDIKGKKITVKAIK